VDENEVIKNLKPYLLWFIKTIVYSFSNTNESVYPPSAFIFFCPLSLSNGLLNKALEEK